ncbi:Holliday junction DNA helicase RuvA [candidate division WWE3 bacterium RIFCSPHIGHO2_01_FULL_40_23]|uniref:Holliday junction branch migration complex subunit RuvA n=1 Tax=candidate division WWE3 bacterium RIFCSPLOWO2_01_FULL_41_18 TaxID=1802625 RepID=A0A1F4VDW2_UNCKA|nr:MAG: Holliday junction DNA helicase RuvA [candidate division WWE3 bacterium RIFCSPHIGHO2_01_FULL_40_23]OGC55359.1 MAG: Holliday junction DNA helicase RuvA [candidate division WWE3 bacterium RIFCSPLOWO2_01_FULL_41_18]
MIGYLKGKTVKLDDTSVIVDVNGVGYKVFLLSNTISTLTNNSINEFYVHTHVKEDQLSLFAFLKHDELKIFQLLLEVSGVGPKTALTILSSLKYEELISAIQKAKVGEFTKISGIGKKLAQKIILELQNKTGKVSDLDLSIGSSDNELIETLLNLGFTKKEASNMTLGIDKDLPLEQKVKISLKKVNEKKRNY